MLTHKINVIDIESSFHHHITDHADGNEFCLGVLILILFNGKIGFSHNLVGALQNHFAT